MIKIVPKGLIILVIVILFGTLLASCGPIFDVGGVNGNGGNGGNPTPQPPSQSGYTAVKASDPVDLAEYLQDEETSYAITLDTEDNDIYLPSTISIINPMKIIGSSGSEYTIHSTNRAGGTTYYSLDLQANLELENCSFTGYNGTSGGLPPLNIRAGKTLTLTGADSVLELRGVGNGTAIRAGSQVILAAGASIVDESGDLLFKSGVEKLVISGRITLNKKLTVGSGGVLQIENGGELRVGPGATLTLNNDLKELKLGGNIVVDRTTDGSVGVLALPDGIDSLLAKITGNGSLTIENSISETTTTPFQYGANTIVRLSSDGISLGKRVSSEIGGVINTSATLTIPKEKKLVVSAGAELNVNKILTLKGGTLDVAGSVNVTSGGQITVSAEDKFNAIPKGTVLIGSNGIITIDGDGTFKDESVTWDNENKTFTFPSYGQGSLVVKHSPAQATSSGILEISGKKIIPDLLALAQSTATSFIIKSGPAYTLTGTGTLKAAGDLALEGRFNIAAGAVLTVSGGTLTVKAPNQLTGTITSPEVVQLKIADSGQVEYYSTGNEIVDKPYPVGDYKWDGPPSNWIKIP